MTLNTSRRGFLRGAAAASAVLVVGIRPDGALAAAGNPSMLTPFVQVGTDGAVTVIIKHIRNGAGDSHRPVDPHCRGNGPVHGSDWL